VPAHLSLAPSIAAGGLPDLNCAGTAPAVLTLQRPSSEAPGLSDTSEDRPYRKPFRILISAKSI